MIEYHTIGTYQILCLGAQQPVVEVAYFFPDDHFPSLEQLEHSLGLCTIGDSVLWM